MSQIRADVPGVRSMRNRLGNHPRGIYALMVMPERSFGRTVRYRRAQLGLSQAKLGELVGRSTATIRSWERDKTRPTDPKVLGALSAVLDIDEKQLFGKAEIEQPLFDETTPTVEQALATLNPTTPRHAGPEHSAGDRIPASEPEPQRTSSQSARQLVGVTSGPAYASPPDPYVQTPLTANLSDVSYMEDGSQRQLYRVRILATLIALVALAIAFIWAIGEGVGAFGDWWDSFFSQLRL